MRHFIGAITHQALSGFLVRDAVHATCHVRERRIEAVLRLDNRSHRQPPAVFQLGLLVDYFHDCASCRYKAGTMHHARSKTRDDVPNPHDAVGFDIATFIERARRSR